MLQRPDVMALFARQRWVAASSQLVGLGLGERTVTRAIRRGEVERVVGPVVGIIGRPDSFDARCLAIHLAAGRRGYLSGQSAGHLYGLRQMQTTPIEYTMPYRLRFSTPDWARLVRSSWPDDEPRPTRDDDLAVSSPLRMLLDVAAALPQRRFERAAEDAWHRELVSPTQARAYLDRIRRSGRPGISTMERWLEHVEHQRRPAATGLELLLIELARRAGLPQPERQHPLRLRTGVLIHLDIAWPDMRLALEPGHSWWHGGDRAQRDDQDRDRRCAELGWQVLRYDESAWNRQRSIVDELATTYRQRHTMFRRRQVIP